MAFDGNIPTVPSSVTGILSSYILQSISPGLVQTEIFEAGGWDDLSKMAPHLQAKDIADAVKYVLSTPANVQVSQNGN